MTGAADRIRGFLAGLKRLSTVGVVLANLVPIACVIAFGWPAAVLLLLYWCENVVIGGINAGKMVASGIAGGRAGIVMGALATPFFVFHYGLFCFVHGVFVMVIGSIGAHRIPDFDPSPAGLVQIVEGLARTEPGFAWSLAAIAGLHLAGFVFDWLAKARFRDTNPLVQMFEPYGRIVVLHLTLMAGTLAVVLLGQPIWALVALAVVKTLFDLGALTQAKVDPEAVARSNAALEALRAKLGG